MYVRVIARQSNDIFETQCIVNAYAMFKVRMAYNSSEVIACLFSNHYVALWPESLTCDLKTCPHIIRAMDKLSPSAEYSYFSSFLFSLNTVDKQTNRQTRCSP